MNKLPIHYFLSLVIAVFGVVYSQQSAAESSTPNPSVTLAELSEPLVGANLRKMPALVERLELEAGTTALPVLEALLAGELYYQRSDKRLVRAVSQTEGGFQISDVFSTDALGSVAKKQIRKVKLNNALRVQLRAAIGRLTLLSDDPKLRLTAIENMLKKPDQANLELLQQARAQETDSDIVDLLNEALALNLLIAATDRQPRLQALRELEGSLQPAVRNALQALVALDADAQPLEQDIVVFTSASRLLDKIDGKLGFYAFLETLFFGLSLGSVLLLIATGLAITFGVMGVINMAHGELIMLGAYTTYVVQLLMPNHIEYSLLVAVPAAFLVSGLVGILIERSVIRFLHGRPLETLLATFGVSLILQQAVRSIFSPLNRQVATPEWMSGSLEINSIFSLTYNRLYVFLFALLVFVLLQLILKRTTLGLNVRAVSQNRSMAKAMGVKTDWVDAMTFGLGSGVAGLAGVALSQLTNVGPNLGQAYIIDSFMVVVFGGVGNLWGTLVAGLSLGVFTKFLEPATGAVMAKILVLVFIVLFIQKRPRGLFPQQGRAAE
ncbi:urea ABC transporter permease subunit UrtB [Halieaceae bacterium IMCC14734]|uniref:Urea ABC transporter permease subunit UrtB n=1 Tax=Candidatus Litorirhabdus singularis TaxID=2518993 RepID=A0ABT3TKH2_9GAMM|nr:urea ABC transporter permease subunit UrtB [Candidatus Litorirhabdus singularis]MCX2982280.1 urea ABC transporter permease subunit UrtB [Candidatus Litorirhabdus singularis]